MRAFDCVESRNKSESPAHLCFVRSLESNSTKSLACDIRSSDVLLSRSRKAAKRTLMVSNAAVLSGLWYVALYIAIGKLCPNLGASWKTFVPFFEVLKKAWNLHIVVLLVLSYAIRVQVRDDYHAVFFVFTFLTKYRTTSFSTCHGNPVDRSLNHRCEVVNNAV